MIDISFGDDRFILTEECYQYSKGERLRFSGEMVNDLKVAFMNEGQPKAGEAYSPDEMGVIRIPDRYFESGENVIAYAVLTGQSGDVQTRFKITIPVIPRPPRGAQP